ncbi:MAG: spore maturation protein [Chlamydiales bacterium]|nr:spore maturation protein [Chlamydiia bacterium]MCP5508479.1 spore maturation protein [Chlamydiales bacterium]
MLEENRNSPINVVFVLFIVIAVLYAGFTGKMQEVSEASFEAAKDAVTLAIGLVGVMALWLGFVRVLEAGGLMYHLADGIRPITKRLFPDVPYDHPAMSAMLLNMSANFLGMGNAATPLGIKAMVELNKLNPFKTTATNAMCLFLAINTSSITLFPLKVIAIRAAAGAASPADIFLPTLIATTCSTIVAITIAYWMAKRDHGYTQRMEAALATTNLVEEQEKSSPKHHSEIYAHLLTKPSLFSTGFIWLVGALLVTILGICYWNSAGFYSFLIETVASYWLVPLLILAIVCYGIARGVKIYEAVTEGAKQGFEIAINIIPFLVAILVAIAMFRASGALQYLTQLLDPFTQLINMPADTLPMALMRPLSGSGAFGIVSDLANEDPNSYSTYLASTMMGSTETTFYVLAVYFGAVGISKIRHALVAAILADVTGILVACFACSFLWQG